MQRDWVPVTVQIGKLPETVTEEPVVLSLDKAVPNGAEEVLIYTFITSKGEGDFHRYYYKIYTSQDGRDYSQYMNIATGQDMNVINSANLWFPMGDDGKVRATLICPEDEDSFPVKKEWSDVFILGYKD